MTDLRLANQEKRGISIFYKVIQSALEEHRSYKKRMPLKRETKARSD